MLRHIADSSAGQSGRCVTRLFGSIGPACANVPALESMFTAGMTGARISLLHRALPDCSAWVDTIRTAAQRSGVTPEVVFALEPNQPLPGSLTGSGATGLMVPSPHDDAGFVALREYLGPSIRLYARIDGRDDIEALPIILRHADEVVICRAAMMLGMPAGTIAPAQKRIAAAAIAAGKPFMIHSDLLYSMREKPFPTSAELLDIYNAVRDGASSLMLTYETSIGKYPVEAIETLRKAADAGEQ